MSMFINKQRVGLMNSLSTQAVDNFVHNIGITPLSYGIS